MEVPVLKHGVMLRLWMGHLNEPERLKALVEAHIANVEEQIRRAKLHADHAENEPAWSFPVMTLRWSERYFRAEIELARELLDDIDRASAEFANVARATTAWDHRCPRRLADGRTSRNTCWRSSKPGSPATVRLSESGPGLQSACCEADDDVAKSE